MGIDISVEVHGLEVKMMESGRSRVPIALYTRQLGADTRHDQGARGIIHPFIAQN